MATPDDLERAREAARAAFVDAEHGVATFYDDFAAFVDRCVRLNELDATSAANVKRCLKRASDNAMQRLRKQLQDLATRRRAGDAIVELTADEAAAFEEWQQTELEKRRWLD
jgi:hypothetical protein